ncbi:programmed cell death protein 2 [Protomyces lactucae-debilis]|uniref:Programmed cell death protein 2 n=1 Tax=Protomyces lactucae-debilis TaxID=2754530 RepID=A0A1Y2FLL9_PROLT|nr:programmed cell death protein 2 [Protomyces lactucae-debilis]ORY84848.1 programmed cell death protein 2 [Protomyces lactucae-debilis]
MGVILGYAEPVGKKYIQATLRDATISRLGGPMASLASSPILAEDDERLLCAVCKKRMRLFLQLFAPESDERPHAWMRVLYLLTCVNGKCAKQGWSPSIKVLRSQSTTTDLHPVSSQEDEQFALNEIVSESEPADVASTKEKEDKKHAAVLVENDGSEKYTKVKGDGAFYKFSKRLQKAPEQVLRYYRTEQLLASSHEAALWIADAQQLADKDIPACACGAARSLEFQMMPTAISFLGQDETKQDSIDYGVLNVYTCNEACRLGNEGYAEEVCWRQEYDMRTSIF